VPAGLEDCRPMPRPQPGIFALGTRSHHHLQFRLNGPAPGVVPAVNRIREAATSVAGVNVVVGFGPALWRSICPAEAPEDIVDFEAVVGSDGFVIPSAQHDLWLWLHSAGPDSVFNIARVAGAHLSTHARLVDELPSFVYGASLDLSGFEDGTENPPLDEAPDVAVIPDGEPCAGGSVALLQRWVHDLDGFEALEQSDREAVIGRTLYGSVELEEHRRPASAHVSRVVIEDDNGEELEIFRRSTAYGGVSEHGLMFVAFSRERSRLSRMLARMAGAEDGVRDRLTEFSTPVSSAWYVVPPVDLLQRLDP